MRYIILAFGLALLTVSCSKKEVGTGDTPGGDSLAAVSYMNVSYGEDNKQRLDVYLPANRNSKTRLLVIAHGGGWSGGDKSDFDSYISEFQKRLPHYAFANVNYRLATQTENHFPTQAKDRK